MFRIVRTGIIFSCSMLLCLLTLVVSGVPHVNAATSPTTNWPLSGFDAQDTKFNPYEKTLSPANVSKLKLAWQQIGLSYGYAYTDSQEVVNGVVYIIDDNGTVYASNALSGKLEWSKTLRLSGLPVSVAVENGLVYVGGSDIDINRDVIYALNAKNGSLAWEVPLPTTQETGMQSDLNYVDGMLFGSWNDGYLRAFNATTGKLLWSQFTISGSASIANGLVYVGSAGYTGAGKPNYFYAFHEKSGTLAWKTEIPNLGRVYSATAVADGIVYGSDVDNGVLLALNATNGKLLWSFSSPANDSTASPAIANGIVYVASTDNHLYAVDAKTGKLRWSFATNGTIEASPAVANGVVYVASFDNNVYALNANSGQKLWSYLIHDNNDSVFHGAPTIVNGMLFVSSSEALSAFHLS